MDNFKPINTQADFEAAVEVRLKQERAKYAGYLSPEDAKKKYDGYMSPVQVAEKYTGYLSPEDAAKKDATIKEYESSVVKIRVANENNIPFELADKLSGETEEEIRADAQKFAKYVGSQNQPLASESNSQLSRTDAAYKAMAQKMN